MQVPVWHAVSGGHRPQMPPQPSGPHVAPVQSGTQPAVHLPAPSQAKPLGQAPQEPPQPSLPHCFWKQLGVHPASQLWPLQRLPGGQAPHEPPHPSGPQVLGPKGVSQLGVQVGMHCPPSPHANPPGHVPHEPPQPSAPHILGPKGVSQLGVHTFAHVPLSQAVPGGHVPQVPPQPFPPHVLPTQLGVHCLQALASFSHGPCTAFSKQPGGAPGPQLSCTHSMTARNSSCASLLPSSRQISKH